MSGPNYNWQRFWVKRDGFITLDDGGYLLDPEGPHGNFNSDVFQFDLVKNIPCLALLGEPGMGKTKALWSQYEHARKPSESLWIDLRSFTSEDRLYRSIFESDQFRGWINAAHDLELFLDSLDECLVHIRTVAALLVDELKRYPVNRLKLRIACRTAEWPALLEQELPKIWGNENYGAFELAPLRRIDVIHAAEVNELDSEAFLAAIERQDVVSLARTPITLDLLVQTFEEGQLPETRSELYEKGCLKLASYTGLSRSASGAHGALSSRERLALAERIAIVTVFSKRSTISLAEDDVEEFLDDVKLSDISEGEELVDGRHVPASEANLREVLYTALFSGRGSQRQGWSHWSYAEFLAARFLSTRGFTGAQIRDLILHPESESLGKVVPQLHETAAWIAAMNEHVLAEILARDPQVLLRSTVTNTDNSTRSRLVDNLLHLLDAEELTDRDSERRYEVLCHPGLPAQLKPYIQEKSKNVVVRRVAIHIAEACRVTDLIPNLLTIALDRSDVHHIRDRAAQVIASIGDAGSRKALVPLLDCDPDEDPDDQLRGNALRALVDILPPESIFSRITEPRQDNFLGSYWAFLHYELPQRLSPANLSAALSWVLREAMLSSSSLILNDLVREVFRAAQSHLDDPQVLDSFVDAIGARAEWKSDLDAEVLRCIAPEHRRNLLCAIARKGRGRDGLRLVRLSVVGLVVKEDFFWLLEQFRAAAGGPEEEVWADLVAMAFDSSERSHIEQAFAAKEDSISLQSALGRYFDPQLIDSPHARWYREQESVRQDEKILKPSVPERVSNLLESFESGDLNAWWQLNMDLTLAPLSTRYSFQSELSSDLTALPGWTEIGEDMRSRCIAAAEVYLRKADPKTEIWLGSNTFYRPAAAGYRALRLLRKYNPEILHALPESVWSVWTPIILAYPDWPDIATAEENQALAAMAYAQAPNEVLRVVKVIIDKENKDHGHLFVLRKLDNSWDEQLAHFLLDYGRSDPTLKPESLGDLLEAIGSHIPEKSLEFGIYLLDSTEDGELSRLKAIEAAVAMLKVMPKAAWPHIWSVIQRDSDLGKDIVLKYSYQTDEGRRALTSRLGEQSIADLYLWLHENFPEDEAPNKHAAHFVGERETVEWLKQGLLTSLQEKGTAEAVAAVRRISTALPEIKWLKYVAISADRARLEKSWDGVSPSVLLKMAQDRRSRLVESEAQLLEVVISSLDRLDQQLQGTPPSVRNLWNHSDMTPKNEEHLSNNIVQHLREDLAARGIVANREVRIRPGESTDVYVDAITAERSRQEWRTISIVMEVKGCWNRGVKEDMEGQFRNRYLRDSSSKSGIYVVGWFLCEEWNKSDYRYDSTPKISLLEARDFFKQQAGQLSDEVATIKSFILNAVWR